MSVPSLPLPFAVPETIALDATFARLAVEDLGEGAWIAHQRRWVTGAERLYTALEGAIPWRSQRRLMYDRVVDVPRLLGRMPDPVPPAVVRMSAVLSARFGADLDRISAALYRDGRDSVAWHGDRLGEHKGWSVVAIVSLGGPRRFLLRPASGGASRRIDLGSGDLLVMGGTAQRTWEHCVPKVAAARPRIALMFRHDRPWGGLPEATPATSGSRGCGRSA